MSRRRRGRRGRRERRWLRARELEKVSDFQKALRQGNGQDIHLTQVRAATGAFGLTTALAGVVESQARSISN
jgi:hypothetical protein